MAKEMPDKPESSINPTEKKTPVTEPKAPPDKTTVTQEKPPATSSQTGPKKSATPAAKKVTAATGPGRKTPLDKGNVPPPKPGDVVVTMEQISEMVSGRKAEKKTEQAAPDKKEAESAPPAKKRRGRPRKTPVAVPKAAADKQEAAPTAAVTAAKSPKEKNAASADAKVIQPPKAKSEKSSSRETRGKNRGAGKIPTYCRTGRNRTSEPVRASRF